jgi:hypothetical protein
MRSKKDSPFIVILCIYELVVFFLGAVGFKELPPSHQFSEWVCARPRREPCSGQTHTNCLPLRLRRLRPGHRFSVQETVTERLTQTRIFQTPRKWQIDLLLGIWVHSYDNTSGALFMAGPMGMSKKSAIIHHSAFMVVDSSWQTFKKQFLLA